MRRSDGLVDTSVFIAQETGRPLDSAALPEEVSISVVTVAELHLGVYAARDTQTRARRFATVDRLHDFRVLGIDEDVAAEWATLRYRLSEAGRRVNINDLWIASIALVHGLPVVTQDDDYDAISDLGGPVVIKV